MYFYELFGLHLLSEIELPELIAGDASKPPDLSIRCVATARPVEGPTYADDTLACNARAFRLARPEADYLVEDGARILVAPMGEDLRTLRVYLLGSIMGALCYQRGWLPMHANAIELNGRAFLVCGDSGTGKSTLAAHFIRRGLRVAGDDVSAIDFAGGGPLARPGVPRVKLWADALDRLGLPKPPEARVLPDNEKYALPIFDQQARTPLPVGGIFILQDGKGGEAPRISPLYGAEAVDALMANTYRASYPGGMGLQGAHFARLAALAAAAPVFDLRRPWGSELLEPLVETLSAKMATLASAP